MRVVLIFVGVIASWPLVETNELMRWEMEVMRGTATKKMSTPARRRVTRVAIRQVVVVRLEPVRVG